MSNEYLKYNSYSRFTTVCAVCQETAVTSFRSDCIEIQVFSGVGTARFFLRGSCGSDFTVVTGGSSFRSLFIINSSWYRRLPALIIFSCRCLMALYCYIHTTEMSAIYSQNFTITIVTGLSQNFKGKTGVEESLLSPIPELYPWCTVSRATSTYGSDVLSMYVAECAGEERHGPTFGRRLWLLQEFFSRVIFHGHGRTLYNAIVLYTGISKSLIFSLLPDPLQRQC